MKRFIFILLLLTACSSGQGPGVDELALEINGEELFVNVNHQMMNPAMTLETAKYTLSDGTLLYLIDIDGPDELLFILKKGNISSNGIELALDSDAKIVNFEGKEYSMKITFPKEDFKEMIRE